MHKELNYVGGTRLPARGINARHSETNLLAVSGQRANHMGE